MRCRFNLLAIKLIHGTASHQAAGFAAFRSRLGTPLELLGAGQAACYNLHCVGWYGRTAGRQASTQIAWCTNCYLGLRVRNTCIFQTTPGHATELSWVFQDCLRPTRFLLHPQHVASRGCNIAPMSLAALTQIRQVVRELPARTTGWQHNLQTIAQPQTGQSSSQTEILLPLELLCIG